MTPNQAASGSTRTAARPVDWTTVYATKLTNGPKTEPRVVPEKDKVGLSQKISRASVASFLVRSMTEDLYGRQGVVVTG